MLLVLKSNLGGKVMFKKLMIYMFVGVVIVGFVFVIGNVGEVIV